MSCAWKLRGCSYDHGDVLPSRSCAPRICSSERVLIGVSRPSGVTRRSGERTTWYIRAVGLARRVGVRVGVRDGALHRAARGGEKGVRDASCSGDAALAFIFFLRGERRVVLSFAATVFFTVFPFFAFFIFFALLLPLLPLLVVGVFRDLFAGDFARDFARERVDADASSLPCCRAAAAFFFFFFFATSRFTFVRFGSAGSGAFFSTAAAALGAAFFFPFAFFTFSALFAFFTFFAFFFAGDGAASSSGSSSSALAPSSTGA